jgi:uncharacterized repeat protein (TIGR04138 family)
MSEQPIISFDLRCESCNYSLRGLPTGHRCPECGEPAPPGVATRKDWNYWKHEQEWGNVAKAIGCSLDALLFVLDAMSVAEKKARRAHAWGTIHLRADDICRAFVEQAQDYFASPLEAVESLRAWGIHRSEDVGCIIYGLVYCGRLTAKAGDRLEDFNGQFTLADLLTPTEK